jgi:galactokinase
MRGSTLVAQAPGRLDVMGGIADYSGADVLELPLACCTRAVLQDTPGVRVELRSKRESGWQEYACELSELSATPAEVRARFSEIDRWAAYPVGVLYRCLQLGADASRGFRLEIDSTVPEGKGVASSAALEVATMMVLAGHFNLELTPAQLAVECQWAENHIVGAPCGVMDQMTAVLGHRDKLLALKCQPGGAVSYVDVPEGYRCYGIDSGVRHAVSGADYGTVRTAAFMGYRILDPAGDAGFLCNVVPEPARLATLPERMSGADFLTRYGGTSDRVTRVDPARSYPVRAATRHPIEEQQRVTRFAELLGLLPSHPEAAVQLGELMSAAHRSYSACGLGSPGTDRLVELVIEFGSERGLFGAKITGGGSGGTVAIFGSADAEPLVRELAARYRSESGLGGEVFAASGPGAEQTGVRRA